MAKITNQIRTIVLLYLYNIIKSPVNVEVGSRAG